MTVPTRVLLLLLVPLALLAHAPAAQAGRVVAFEYEEETDDFRPDIYYYGVIRFTAGPGERNRVTVRRRSDEVYLVRDSGARLSVGGGCERLTRHSAECTIVDGGDGIFVRVNLGGGDDRLATAGRLGRATLDADGGLGNDTLTGTAGDDALAGGGGNDRLFGARGHDVLDGGPGRDRVSGNDGRDDVSGGTGRDRLLGGDGNDRMRAADGATKVASDRIDGGPGRLDLLTYERRRLPVRASLRAGATSGSAGERDRATGIERLGGGSRDDRLTGDERANRFILSPGDDTIDARGGDDLIGSGEGLLAPDALDVSCGAGRDRLAVVSVVALARPDCEELSDYWTSPRRAQPVSVTADAVVVELPCASAGTAAASREATLRLPAAGPRWAAPGPYDTVLARGVRPEGQYNTTCPTTLGLTPEGRVILASRDHLPVTVHALYAGWSFVLVR